MNERIRELAIKAGAGKWGDSVVPAMMDIEKFAELVRADERGKVAQWMIERSYATGHGDTIEDLLAELEWQVAEQECEACAKVIEQYCGAWDDEGYALTQAIRARGEK